jgi:hypothetical protein
MAPVLLLHLQESARLNRLLSHPIRQPRYDLVLLNGDVCQRKVLDFLRRYSDYDKYLCATELDQAIAVYKLPDQ